MKMEKENAYLKTDKAINDILIALKGLNQVEVDSVLSIVHDEVKKISLVP